MAPHHLKLVTGNLYRSPLRLTEGLDGDPTAHRHSWDLGYHHAHRGKDPEPNNPHVADAKSYIAGYEASKKETAAQGAPSQVSSEPARIDRSDRPEQDIEPSMHLSLDDVPESVGTLASTIAEHGGRALLIGGAVRDKLMGKEPKDFDIEVYGLDTDRLVSAMETHGDVDAVGKQFGVLKIVIGNEDFDVSVPRREVKTGPGHKDFDIIPDPSMTIKEAAKRRDFTMNTVAMDPHDGGVFDPYGGVDDIQNKILRATDPNVFIEDSLRILRGAQFAARFKMSVEPQTMELMKGASVELPNLPRERIGTEWRKLLMKGDKPSLGLDVMKETGALQQLHPELDALSEQGTWDQTKAAVDRAVDLTRDSDPEIKQAVRYGALVHAVPTQGMAQRLHNTMDVSKDLSAKVETLVGEQGSVRDNMSDAEIRHMSHRMKQTKGSIEELAQLTHAVRGDAGTQPAANLLQRAEALGVHRAPPRPLLQGRDLMQMGIKPGPHIGKVLKHVYNMQLDGHVVDDASAQAAAQEALTQREWDSSVLKLRRGGLNLL